MAIRKRSAIGTRLRSVNIDEDTHFKLKQAALHGKTLAELVKELVDRFLPKVVKP